MRDKPTALYRYFDDKDRLLYIGISSSLGGRHKTHIGSSHWMELTARSEVVRYPSRAKAEDAEREAIKTEQPLFNKQHNDTPKARERLSAYLREIGRTDLEPTPAVVRLTPVTSLQSVPPEPQERITPVSALASVVEELVGVTKGIVESSGALGEVVRHTEALAWATNHMAGLLMETISRVEKLERRLDAAGNQRAAYEQLALDGNRTPPEDEVA